MCISHANRLLMNKNGRKHTVTILHWKRDYLGVPLVLTCHGVRHASSNSLIVSPQLIAPVTLPSFAILFPVYVLREDLSRWWSPLCRAEPLQWQQWMWLFPCFQNSLLTPYTCTQCSSRFSFLSLPSPVEIEMSGSVWSYPTPRLSFSIQDLWMDGWWMSQWVNEGMNGAIWDSWKAAVLVTAHHHLMSFCSVSKVPITVSKNATGSL